MARNRCNLTQNLELQSSENPNLVLDKQTPEDSQLNLISIMDRAIASRGEHTTDEVPGESDASFNERVADALSGRMAERTFSQLRDFESSDGFTFSDVERMHRLVATKKNPGPDDYIKMSSDLICTAQLTPGAPESGSLHFTKDQFRRFLKDQIIGLEPGADRPAVSEPIPIFFIVDGRRKEIGATLQLTEDATGDVMIPLLQESKR